MPGPMGFLAGLGGFGQGFAQAQDQALQQQIRRLQVANYLRQQQQDQQQQQARSRLFSAALAGGLDQTLGRLGDGFGEAPQPAQMIPQPASSDVAPSPGMNGRRYVPTPIGSGFSSGLETLTSLGVRPDVATGAIDYMRSNESGEDPLAVNPSSGALGRAQWLGPRKAALTSQYGDRPSDEQQAAFMGSELQGPESRTLDRLRSATTAKEGYDIWGRDFERPGAAALARAGVGGGIPAQARQQAQQTARRTIQTIPPMGYGRMSLQALAQQIDKADPGGDPVVKMMALEMAVKLLAPSEQRQWQLFQMQNRQDMQIALEQMREQFRAGQSQLAGYQFIATPEGVMRANPRTGQVEAAPLPEQSRRLGQGTPGGKINSQNIKITAADGRTIFQGSAHPAPGARPGESSWVDDKTQKRIDVPEDATLTVAGRGDPGRQAAAQMVRLTSAANEARRQIANVARAAKGSTTSWFQGLQSESGRSLSEGLRRVLANELTPTDEQIMSVLGRGIGRSLASLETAGAATGLVNLQQNMQALMPAKGDSVETALTKIAEMRQIAEQGIESAIAAPAVQDEQRKLLRAVRDDIVKAVPYTVGDVLDMVQNPGEETYASFAAKIGLGRQGAQGPPVAAIEDLKKADTPERRRQFDEIFGQGAAARALGQ